MSIKSEITITMKDQNPVTSKNLVSPIQVHHPGTKKSITPLWGTILSQTGWISWRDFGFLSLKKFWKIGIFSLPSSFTFLVAMNSVDSELELDIEDTLIYTTFLCDTGVFIDSFITFKKHSIQPSWIGQSWKIVSILFFRDP